VRLGAFFLGWQTPLEEPSASGEPRVRQMVECARGAGVSAIRWLSGENRDQPSQVCRPRFFPLRNQKVYSVNRVYSSIPNPSICREYIFYYVRLLNRALHPIHAIHLASLRTVNAPSRLVVALIKNTVWNSRSARQPGPQSTVGGPIHRFPRFWL
jgi:hypothetical protein